MAIASSMLVLWTDFEFSSPGSAVVRIGFRCSRWLERTALRNLLLSSTPRRTRTRDVDSRSGTIRHGGSVTNPARRPRRPADARRTPLLPEPLAARLDPKVVQRDEALKHESDPEPSGRVLERGSRPDEEV